LLPERFFFMGKQLIIDWGNTRVKMALFEGKEMLNSFTASNLTMDGVKTFLGSDKHIPVLLCSVTKKSDELEAALRKSFPSFIKLSHQTPVPVAMQYQSPDTLGYDRLANAVAVSRLVPPGCHALAIDSGTCLKFDFVHHELGYMGGAISPGFRMRYSALHNETDGLPMLEPVHEVKLIGNTTALSMHSGVINGMLGEIESVIARYSNEFSPLVVYLTGGDAHLFEKVLKNGIFAHSFLTLAGLNDILEFNQNA
jgi:type III pantothenate kinase